MAAKGGGLVNVYAGNEVAASAARSAFDFDGVDFLVKLGEHVASILKITNESRGVGGEDVASVLTAEGKDFLDFAVVLAVLIDHGAANGSTFALDAGELLDRRGLGEVVQVFVVFDVQLVKNVHGFVFLSVVGSWLDIDIIHQYYGKCKYLLLRY